MNGSSDPSSFAHRLAAATNAHDIDALVACFAEDYRNETPVHPARGFRGADQVRRNWTQLFAGMPDLAARVLATAVDGDTAWSEWEMSGRRPDGTAHLMRGVIIFGVRDGQAAWARFYLEPVETAGGDVDAAVARASGGPGPGGRA
jgi:ketosteroid isomerase-like protein